VLNGDKMTTDYRDSSNHETYLKVLLALSKSKKDASKNPDNVKRMFLHEVVEKLREAGMHFEGKEGAGKERKDIVYEGKKLPPLNSIRKHINTCMDALELNGARNGVPDTVLTKWRSDVKSNILMIKDVPDTANGTSLDTSYFDEWDF
jgi:hypothetical protein